MAETILVSNEALEVNGIVITGGPTVSASLGVENLLTRQPSEYLQFSSADDADKYVVVNFTADTPQIDTVALLYTTKFSHWRVRAANLEADLTSSPFYDSTVMAASSGGSPNERGQHLFHQIRPDGPGEPPSAIGVPWWRFDFQGIEANGTAAVLVMGEALQAGLPIANGWSFGATNTFLSQTSMGGQVYRRRVSGTNYLEMTFQMDSYAEAAELHDSLRQRAEALPVFAVIDPDLTGEGFMNQMAWGTLTATSPVQVPVYGFWTCSVRVEELP